MIRSRVKCICEICCCGRHRCPHRPKAITPWGPCIMSEYTAQYHPQCIQPNKPIIPASNLFASGDPISNKTTNRNDYVPYPYEEPYKHPPVPYKAPEGKMDDTTLYRNEYTPKVCAPPQPVKPPERRGCSAKFDGLPTYRADYRPWDLPPIVLDKRKQDRPLLPKFNAEPTYRSEYVPKCIEKSTSYKPQELPKVHEPFKGDTMYRTEFVPRPLEPQTAIKPPTYARSRAPFETLTTNRKDYTPKEYCPNPPAKPVGSVLGSTGQMSKTTTNRTDYKDWGPQYPERAAAPQHRPLEGDRSFDSTYRNDFGEKPLCPVTSVKAPETKRCDAKFDGTTNYRHDYKLWDVPPRSPAFKPTEWSRPDVPFDDATTNRTNFVPPPCLVVPEPVKPKVNCFEGGPFDDRTSYRTDYVPKETCPCCPAGFLPTDDVSPDGYVFDHYDDRGHQQYRNVGTGKKIMPAIAVN